MNHVGAGAIRIGTVLPLVIAIAMSLGVAQAGGVDAGSPSAARSAVAGQPATAGDLAQSASKTESSTAASAANQVQTLQAVTVTGTRIPQPALTGSAALQSISIREIRLEGAPDVTQLLSSVPSAIATPSDGSGTENSFSTVGLRGMGPNRTLVLIDGNRVVPGDATAFNTAATDVNGTNLNFIPTALVERVEVLTGGASAIYGSDAIAGVVNFVMRQDFQGFSFDGQWSQSGSGDGTNYTPTLIWGANSADGKGNVTLYASYTQQSPVSTQARAWNRCAFLPNGKGGRACFGSSITSDAQFTSLDRPLNDNKGQINPDGTRTFVPFGHSLYNFDQATDLVRADRRYNFGGFAHQKINDHVEVYGSAMFMQDRDDYPDSPIDIGFGGNAVINCSNPLMSSSQQAFLCPNPGQTKATTVINQRLPEVGNRYTVAVNTEYRIQLGLKGAISNGWNYDVSAQRSQNSVSQTYFNYASGSRAQQAMQVTTDSSGNPVCINPAGGCVPLDLFRLGGITPAMADYIRAEGLENGTTTEEVATASVNGDLGQYNLRSPFAKDGLKVAGGLEYRRDSLDFLPDPGLQSGDTTGGKYPPVNGNFNVSDAFSELQVPLAQGQPFIKDLSLDAAYRYSKYRIATQPNETDTHAYKLGLRYAPDDDIALRASWNRSVRAPDLQELFFPATVTAVPSGDPCSGSSPTASLAQCANTGVTAAEYGNIQQCPSTQCSVRVGGNLNLKPEESITRQLGLVLTPGFLKGFTGTVDYYDIVLTNAIGTISPETVLGECLGGDAAYCSEIQRGPTGNLFGGAPGQTYISATDINTGFLRSRGFDVSFNYNRYLSDLGLGNNGQLEVNMTGTYVSDFDQKETPSSPEFNCAGLYGHVCSLPNARWRHKLRVTWENPMNAVPGLAVSAQWRYISGVALDSNQDNPQLNPTGARFNATDARIPAISYLDLSGTYELPFQNQDVSLRFGINNVTDRNPPIVTFAAMPIVTVQTPPNNTFAGLYDILGRVFFVGVHANFQ